MASSTISGVNRLTEDEKRHIYARILPPVLLMRFNLSLEQLAAPDSPLLKLQPQPGTAYRLRFSAPEADGSHRLHFNRDGPFP